MQEKRPRIRKKVCRGRVRAFNLPIRSLGRYPYTTGSEGICGRILLTTLGLETQKCSETVFTTSKQRTVQWGIEPNKLKSCIYVKSCQTSFMDDP